MIILRERLVRKINDDLKIHIYSHFSEESAL